MHIQVMFLSLLVAGSAFGQAESAEPPIQTETDLELVVPAAQQQSIRAPDEQTDPLDEELKTPEFLPQPIKAVPDEKSEKQAAQEQQPIIEDPSEVDLPTLHSAPPAPTPKKKQKREPSKPSAPPDAYTPWGAGPFLTGAGQVGLGLVLTFLSAQLGPFSALIGPMLSSSGQVLLGDLMGQKRGAWLPTFLSILVAQNALMVLNSALLIAGYITNYIILIIGTVILGTNSSPVLAIGLTLVGSAGILSMVMGILPATMMFLTLGQIIGSMTYHFFGEDKRPHDDGDLRFPGILSPSHPKVSISPQHITEDVRKQAMAY